MVTAVKEHENRDAQPDEKTERAKAFVGDVLEERGMTEEGIKKTVNEAVADAIKETLGDRLKVLEDGAVNRLSDEEAENFVPGLRESGDHKRFNYSRAIAALYRKQVGGDRKAWDRYAPLERDIIKAGRDELVRRMIGEDGAENLFVRATMTTIDSSAGFWVPPEISSKPIPELRPDSVLAQIGPNMVAGLTGTPFPVPKEGGGISTYWVGEGKKPTETYVATESEQGTMKKLAALTHLSREAILFSNPSIEEYVKRQMFRETSLEIDRVAFYGSGSSFQPMGIANWLGIQTEAGDTTHGATNIHDDFENMIGKLDIANVPNEEKWTWVFNAKVKAMLRKLRDADNRPWWDRDPRTKALANTILGYKWQRAGILPSNLGTGSNESDVFFMDPTFLWYLQWAGQTIALTDQNKWEEDLISIRITTILDFIVTQAKAFVKTSPGYIL